MVGTRVASDIPARFRTTASRFGESIGVCSDQGDWSYAALDRASDGVAGALAAAGLREGDRMGLLCGNGAEFVIAYLGVLKAGGTLVPLNLLLNPKETAAFQERFGIPILEGDGPTECGPVTCVNPIAGVRKPGSIGLPIPTVETRILDSEGREVADGIYGEVCVRGPSVMQGYHNQPEATRESFFDDWFRTGDLGYRDADGYVYLVDRIKDLIITNGINVYPRVIEEALYAHPEVAEAAVVGDLDARHGEIPVAHVVLRTGSSATEASLRVWCREHLGRHEVPRRLVIRDALLKNAAGKILKRELRRSGDQERGVDPA